jgi:hypothetical protein
MLLCLFFGAVLFLTSAWSFSDLRSQAGYASVQGQVVTVEQDRRLKQGRDRVECEVHASYTVAGTTYRIQRRSEGVCDVRAGDALTVRYDPSYPRRATLQSPADDAFWAWGGAVGAVLSGIVAPVVLTARAISRWKKRRSSGAAEVMRT